MLNNQVRQNIYLRDLHVPLRRVTRRAQSPRAESADSTADGPNRLQEQPVDGATPSVELLHHVPSTVAAPVDIFSEPVEAIEGLDDESASPLVLRAIVTRLIERQHSDREVFQSALKAYQDLTERLAMEVAETRGQLASQTQAARLEREHLVKEFLDRFDVLSAKISTSASRFAAELETKDRNLEDQERRLLAYAGQAATAQSVIEDIYGSSSWRFTAPLRLMSRMMNRRTSPAPH